VLSSWIGASFCPRGSGQTPRTYTSSSLGLYSMSTIFVCSSRLTALPTLSGAQTRGQPIQRLWQRRVSRCSGRTGKGSGRCALAVNSLYHKCHCIARSTAPGPHHTLGSRTSHDLLRKMACAHRRETAFSFFLFDSL